MLAILPEIAQGLKCEIIEANGQEDHIHLLLRFPPTAVLSEVIGALKSKSASALLDRFGSFYWGKHQRTVWSSGFFLCSVGGATLEVLKAYLEKQSAPNPP